MKHDIEDFKSRFANAFANEGLVNIKFFVRPSAPASFAAFACEAVSAQEAIDKGAYTEIPSIDGNLAQTTFKEAFGLQ